MGNETERSNAVTYVKNFKSLEEGLAWMSQQTEEANTQLAPQQRDLTFGSYWVRFVDVGARIVEFGHVLELDDIPMDDEDGESIETQRAEMTANTERGYLYSDCWSILGYGRGDTHRFNAWPIEQRLFDMAKAVDWKIDDLDETGKVLLEIAYRSFVVHLRSLA